MNFLFRIQSFLQVYPFVLPSPALRLTQFKSLTKRSLFHFSMQLMGPVDFLVNLANWDIK